MNVEHHSIQLANLYFHMPRSDACRLFITQKEQVTLRGHMNNHKSRLYSRRKHVFFFFICLRVTKKASIFILMPYFVHLSNTRITAARMIYKAVKINLLAAICFYFCGYSQLMTYVVLESRHYSGYIPVTLICCCYSLFFFRFFFSFFFHIICSLAFVFAL